MFDKLILLVLAITFLGACNNIEKVNREQKLPEIVDYNMHIKPILSDRCYACHGPDKNALKAGLELFHEKGALSELPENPGFYAIVPGNLEKSEMVRRIHSTDPEVQMPPPESNLTLSNFERKLISKWIEQGAEFKPHWSLIPVEKPAIPPVKGEWVTNPIDNFIMAMLDGLNMEPEPEASREKLLRRVTFDLTGLPPTLEEIDRFIKDDSEDAYEKAVDKLLNSEAYAENMTSKWLDIARYADSHGYQVDFYRSMWPWRDWVIKAYKENMSFDSFITWQMAGDLLPGATWEQKLATGFNRNHSINQEGGIVQEEFRVEYVADRTNTLGTALLGLTLECARCHDHKYDPISQKNYYELYGFFNSVPERGNLGGKAPGPSVTYPEDSLDYYRSFLKEVEFKHLKRLKNRKDELERSAFKDVEFNRWFDQHQISESQDLKASFDPISYYSFDDFDSTSYLSPINKSDEISEKKVEPMGGKYASGLFFGNGYNYPLKIHSSNNSEKGFSLSFWFYKSYYLSRHRILSSDNGRGTSWHLESNFKNIDLRIQQKDSEDIVLTSSEQIEDLEWINLSLTYDGSGRTGGFRLWIDGVETPLVGDPLQKLPEHRGLRSLVVGQTGLGGSGIDELYVYDKPLNSLEINSLYKHNPIEGLIAQKPENLSIAERSVLIDHFLYQADKKFKTALRNIEAVKYKYLDIPKEGELQVMTMADMEEPAQTFVLKRGAYDAPGEEVKPGTPQSILTFSDSLPKNRLGLSEWLFSMENPLTSRVAVNRYWQYIFGRGIVETLDDFGNQGAMPSHPELLDWLSATFMESGWDIKALLKMMVMSSTYKQSSETSAVKRKSDPENRFYARGMRYRLSIEQIRDQALAVSGLLNDRVGGPGVRPYQPENLWRSVTAVGGGPLASYVLDISQDHYRRSMYTFWKRTVPPPAMLTFDASTRDRCEVIRQKTNTPLQALVLLNDPQFMEAARVLAAKQVKAGYEPKESIIDGFRKLTSRNPSEEEVALLYDVYENGIEKYQNNPALARQLIKIGDSEVDNKLDAPDLAARTLVVSTLLNLDETITKE